MPTTLRELVEYLDEYLGTRDFPDYAVAHNGLQVEATRETISRVAFAVDASQVTIDDAILRGAELIVVHHGLFWDGTHPMTGRRYRRIKSLMNADVALYSAHLPLDAHPEVGNNAVLAREMGIEIEGAFGDYKGTSIGVWGRLEIRREALAARLDQILGARVRMIGGGPERVSTVGVITGGAGSQIHEARKAGLDAFITGEGAHHNYFDAEEGGINLYLGGHYATEVWGVKALASRVGERFGVQTEFIDHPTGL
jgi:dinuclear metal center YbgI/SA1388 family protein